MIRGPGNVQVTSPPSGHVAYYATGPTAGWGPYLSFVSAIARNGEAGRRLASVEVQPVRTRKNRSRWLKDWNDWFQRVRTHLSLNPEGDLSDEQTAYLIAVIDRDAIAGELFSTQLPPGQCRYATQRVVRKLDALSGRLCNRLLAQSSSLYSTGNHFPWGRSHTWRA